MAKIRPNQPEDTITFKTALLSCWKKTLNYSGHAYVSEYWYFMIFNIIVAFVILLAGPPLLTSSSAGKKLLFYVLLGCIAVLLGLPFIALTVRRLRDAGISDLGICCWLILLVFLPVLRASSLGWLNFFISVFGIFELYILLAPTNKYFTQATTGWRRLFLRHKN